MGIVIEPPEYVIGLKKFEQFIYRTQPEGVRSGAGDIDLVMYSLRKFMYLLLKGNPSIQNLLFMPSENLYEVHPIFKELKTERWRLIARNAIPAYLGYMKQQRERMEGKRGQKNVRRPELVEQYGFDTKYAGHLIRLGIQGVQLLREGFIEIPMLTQDANLIKDIRTGKYSMEKVVSMSYTLEDSLRYLADNSPLPDEPDFEWANKFLIKSYQRVWSERS